MLNMYGGGGGGSLRDGGVFDQVRSLKHAPHLAFWGASALFSYCSTSQSTL